MKIAGARFFLPFLFLILSQNIYSFEPIKSHSVIIDDLDWVDITTLDDSSPIRVNSYAVADVRIPRVGARCTGFLIAADVLMTNRHCVESRSQTSGLTAAFRHETGVLEQDWQKYVCDEFIGNDSRLDYALIRCKDRPGDIHGYLKLQEEKVEDDSNMYVVHQNCDYYTSRGCDPSKKLSRGTIVKANYVNTYVHNADTLGGSSGSPVFSADTHHVISIHHAGSPNGRGNGRGSKNFSIKMSKIIPHIKARYPDIDLD